MVMVKQDLNGMSIGLIKWWFYENKMELVFG